jgi:uncharacterized membrane protein HdeD (DUF308 family)
MALSARIDYAERIPEGERVSDGSLLRDVLTRWWIPAVRGVVAILFGIAAWLWPRSTLGILVTLFGAFALVDGALAALNGLRSRWWPMLALGLLGIAVGVFTFLRPRITVLILLYTLAAWAIGRGVMEIAAAIRLRKEMTGEWLLMLAGFASIVFGGLVIAFPRAGALSLVWVIGGYALVVGVLSLGLALKMRREAGRGRSPYSAAAVS